MQKLDEHLLRELRERLEKDKQTVSKRLEELQKQDPFSNPDRLNDNASDDTEAGEESGHDRVSAIVDELKSRLLDIDAALLRMDNGTYGTCTNCGQLTQEARLRILPAATLCLDCEKK